MKNFLLYLTLTLVIYACPLLPDDNINENCDHSYYNFDLPVSFVPNDELIKIGDTITITSIIPKEKHSTDSNVLFVFDSVDFKISNHFVRFDTLLEKNKPYSFTNDFKFIVDSVYNFYRGDNIISVDYNYVDEEYFIEYNIVPKVKGIYLFKFVSRIGLTENINGKIIHAVDSDCITDEWRVHFMTNEGNNYRELLLESPNEDYNTYIYNNWSEYNLIKGAHCFKVE